MIIIGIIVIITEVSKSRLGVADGGGENKKGGKVGSEKKLQKKPHEIV